MSKIENIIKIILLLRKNENLICSCDNPFYIYLNKYLNIKKYLLSNNLNKYSSISNLVLILYYP